MAPHNGALSTVSADVCSARFALDLPAGIEVAALVHAVGAPLAGSVLEARPGDILHALDLKVNGLLRLIRSVENRLTAGSRIIAIGGNLGFDPTPMSAIPGISNAALANVVRQLSRHFGDRGVTAHLVAPGPVDTPRLRVRAAQEAEQLGVSLEQVVAGYASASPIGRLISTEEVAWAVELLLSPEAAAMSGSTLFVDGGARTALP